MLPENIETTEHREQTAVVSASHLEPSTLSSRSFIGGRVDLAEVERSGRSALIGKYKVRVESMVLSRPALFTSPRGGYTYLRNRNRTPRAYS